MMGVSLDRPEFDEALFSMVSCYGEILCVERWPAFLKDLFGYHASLCPTLAFNLDYVAKETRNSLGMCGVDLAEQTTTYPYLAKFLDPEEALRLLREVLILCPGLKETKTLCLARNRLVVRYCRACWSEDLQNRRRRYWRRTHQLPGIVICPWHELLLCERNIHSGRVIPWPAASPCPEDTRLEFELSVAQREAILAVARRSRLLLFDEEAQIETCNERLRERARESGYGSGRWSVTAKAIASDMIQFFGEKYLASVGGLGELHGNWVAERLGARRSAAAALPYILLDVFLNHNPTRTLKTNVPCPNIFADHEHPHWVDWMVVRGGRYFASCRCGYGFSFVKDELGKISDVHVDQYGFYYAKEARRLREAGMSFRLIAHRLSVSKSTACRLSSDEYGSPPCVSVESCRARLGREWQILAAVTGGAKAACAVNSSLLAALTHCAPEYLQGGRGMRSFLRVPRSRYGDLP